MFACYESFIEYDENATYTKGNYRCKSKRGCHKNRWITTKNGDHECLVVWNEQDDSKLGYCVSKRETADKVILDCYYRQ